MRLIPDDLFGFLTSYPEEVIELFRETRDFILAIDEDVYELIWDNYNALAVAYSPSENLRDAYCHIATYSTYVNLGFNQGVHLRDPKRVLKGEGSLIRHVSIKDVLVLDSEYLKKLVKGARRFSHEMNPWPSNKGMGTTSIVKSISEKKRRPL